MPGATRGSASKSKSVEPVAGKEVEAKGKEKEKDEGVSGQGEEAADGEEEEEGDEEDEEEEEGEFEVEAIHDHMQERGRYSYLVGWKGYGSEHNTWEPETNLEHAKAMIQAYWAKGPKGGQRSQPTAKRGRPSSSSSRAPPAKRSARSNGTRGGGKGKGKEESESEDEPGYEDTHKGDAEQYKDVESWEDLVKEVDTIERGDKGLTVFLTMKDGTQCATTTDVAYARCPQRILKFYEAHLKWRM